MLDGDYVLARESDGVVARQLLGLKHARDRYAHAFDLLEAVEPGGNPADRDFDTPAYWKWRELPPSRRQGNDLGEQEYRTLLAGRLVQSTLTQVLTFLRSQAWIVDKGYAPVMSDPEEGAPPPEPPPTPPAEAEPDPDLLTRGAGD